MSCIYYLEGRENDVDNINSVKERWLSVLDKKASLCDSCKMSYASWVGRLSNYLTCAKDKCCWDVCMGLLEKTKKFYVQVGVRILCVQLGEGLWYKIKQKKNPRWYEHI